MSTWNQLESSPHHGARFSYTWFCHAFSGSGSSTLSARSLDLCKTQPHSRDNRAAHRTNVALAFSVRLYGLTTILSSPSSELLNSTRRDAPPCSRPQDEMTGPVKGTSVWP